MGSLQLALYGKILLFLAVQGIACFLSVLIKHFFLVSSSDLENVQSQELKFSKKRCDIVNGFFCIVICFIQIVGGLWFGFNVVPSIIRGAYKAFAVCFGVCVLSIPGTVLTAFSRYSGKAAVFAGLVYFLQGASFIVLNDKKYHLVYETYYLYYICFAGLIIMGSMRRYNRLLKELKGYPYFSDYEGKLKNASKDTYRSQEKQTVRLAHLSAEDFFDKENDIEKELKKAEQEDSPIDTSSMDFDGYFEEVEQKRRERAAESSSADAETDTIDLGSFFKDTAVEKEQKTTEPDDLSIDTSAMDFDGYFEEAEKKRMERAAESSSVDAETDAIDLAGYYDEIERQRMEAEQKKDKNYWLGS